MKNTIDIQGVRFGRLVAVSETERKDKSRQYYWACLCDCGKSTEVVSRSLRAGLIISCGCYGVEQRKKANTSHDMHKSSEYLSWGSMIQRCRNEKSTNYYKYGGRGIDVCERWMEFENFYEDMGEKPSKEFSIERLNNSLGYSKGNCIWADKETQARNTRIFSTNKSGVKGVRFLEKENKWVAYINVKNRQIHIGRFADKESAAKARKEAEEMHWGDDLSMAHYGRETYQ